MQGHLFKNINDNKYYLIDNVGAYNYIVIEFETFKNMFMSIETVERSMIDVEFNIENIKNLLNEYAIFNDLIDYEHFETNNYIIYHNRAFYIRNWVDIYNFVNNII